jgi:hypothetical protein
MSLRHGVAGGAEGVADRSVGIEVHLPVVACVRVRPYREYRTAFVEVDDFDVGRRFLVDQRPMIQTAMAPATLRPKVASCSLMLSQMRCQFTEIPSRLG